MAFFSHIEPIYFLLPLAGLLVGLFGTMLGGGGGFFFLPLLTLLVGVPTQTAVITSLMATLPICIIGTLGHSKKSNIDFKTGFLFSVAGIIGAFLGAWIVQMISPGQLKSSFGIYSVLIAFNIVQGTKRKNLARNHNGEVPKGVAKKVKGSFYGFFGGLITGTFGTSGTAPVIAGLFSLHIPLKLVVGTSLLVVLVNTVFAIGAHFLVGSIDLTLVLFLTAGSAIGALLGPKILSKINVGNSENKVRYLYAMIMAAIGILMIVG